MNRFKVGGALICLGCIVLAGLFIWGLVAGEPWRFWAIAAPEKAPKTQTKEKSAASSTS
jgi:hypothetical protein